MRCRPSTSRSSRSSARGELLVAVLATVMTLAGGATEAGAQWVESPGRGWLDVSVFHLDTREAFPLTVTSRPFHPTSRRRTLV